MINELCETKGDDRDKDMAIHSKFFLKNKQQKVSRKLKPLSELFIHFVGDLLPKKIYRGTVTQKIISSTNESDFTKKANY
jgi:hypothetical protein